MNNIKTSIEEGIDHKGEINLTNPDKRDIVDVLIGIEKALLSINQKLNK